MIIAVDTNVLLSSLLLRSPTVTFALLLAFKNHDVCLSDFAMTEFFFIGEEKFGIKKDSLSLLFRPLPFNVAVYENGDDHLVPCPIRDPLDIPIVATAIKINAQVLLSGDKDLAGLKIGTLTVMRPRDFLDSFGMESAKEIEGGRK